MKSQHIRVVDRATGGQVLILREIAEKHKLYNGIRLSPGQIQTLLSENVNNSLVHIAEDLQDLTSKIRRKG